MMKTLLYVGSALIGGALMLQMPATPPMRMGLWETTSNFTMTGVQMPPGMATGNQTVKARQCFTPETWAKALGASQRQQSCTRSNEVYGANHYSFDVSCPNSGTTGHFDMTFESKESGHATLHMDMNNNGHAMSMNSTIESHFVSADCGNVSPDRPQMVH
jgi:Protein of unknown function (DUF3617)